MRRIDILVLSLPLLGIVLGSAIGPQENQSDFLQQSCFDISDSIFQTIEQKNSNFIFSPFGYTVILGILAEGADGTTREQLAKLLHYPADLNTIRDTFKHTLQRLQDKSSMNPEFQNYFYVYKNFSVEDDFKKTLLEYYFTDIRTVERVTFDEDTETPTDAPETTTLQQEAIKHERIKRLARRFLGINLENSSKSELSGFSANRLYSAKFLRGLSRMTVFNALYFKGLWKTPFQYKQGEESFYASKDEKISTKMMYTVGQFNVGQLPELDSVVLSVPYKGERYSFVIILPNDKFGLARVLRNFHQINIKELPSKLEQRHVQISIPSFQFKTINYLRDSSNKLGINQIFTAESNFNSISKGAGLFVDDIVQLVTINVENDAATPNFLTASSVQTRTVTEKFTADHPFAFFVLDHKDNIIIASGTLYKPTKDED